MEIKTLLINPPFKYTKFGQVLPLGLLNLGTILVNQGFETHILDMIAYKPYNSKFAPNPLNPKLY